MKKIIMFCLAAAMLAGCGLNRQARQIEALEKCTYEILSADSIYLAGRDIDRIIKTRNIEISNFPELALAAFRKNIPLQARVNLRIENPGEKTAAINQFDYIILIKDQEIATGSVNKMISITPGGSTVVPVHVNSNLYSFLTNGTTMQEILEFLNGGETEAEEKKGVVTIKIKPTIEVAGQLVRYPGYITVNREVSSKILF
jgi:LEA14-like dessication related protein